MDSGSTLSPSNARVVIVDDHNLIRHAVRTILENTQGFSVAGEALNGDDAIQLLQRERPEIVLLDIGLPGKSGLEILKQLKATNTASKVIVLSMHEDSKHLSQALSNGASGYLTKTTTARQLVDSLKRVQAGEVVVAPELEATLKSLDQSATSNGDALKPLSPRERELFMVFAEGHPNRVIAKKFFISPRTVETHRARVIKKLGLKSNADLIKFAIRHELVSV